MALWNAPETVIDHQMKACETALLYQARLAAMQDGMVGGRSRNQLNLHASRVSLSRCQCTSLVASAMRKPGLPTPRYGKESVCAPALPAPSFTDPV